MLHGILRAHKLNGKLPSDMFSGTLHRHTVHKSTTHENDIKIYICCGAIKMVQKRSLRDSPPQPKPQEWKQNVVILFV